MIKLYNYVNNLNTATLKSKATWRAALHDRNFSQQNTQQTSQSV